MLHLVLPEERRSSSDTELQTPPNTPVNRSSRQRSLKTKVSVAVGGATVILLTSLFVVFAGLVGLVKLKTAVYLSVVLTAVAGAFIFGVWRGGVVSLRSDHPREEESLLCVAEVAVDAETQLTVRSWWPGSLAPAEVRSNGIRVAMENAERWVAANRGDSLPEISFDQELLISAIPQYLCCPPAPSVVSPQQCAVCFEEIADLTCLRLCGHGVHTECVAAWFMTSKRATCPMCRCDHSALLPAEVKINKVPVQTLRLLHVHVQRASLTPTHST